MSSKSDQYSEEVYYDEDENDPYEDERDERRLPFFPVNAWRWWPTAFGRRNADERPEDRPYDHGEAPREEDDSWWDEGLITLLLVGGFVLFIFPEPVTSGIGIVLMGIGVLAWLVDWAMG